MSASNICFTEIRLKLQRKILSTCKTLGYSTTVYIGQSCIRRKLTGEYGIANNRIILEEMSSDTEENLAFCLDIIGDSNTSVGIVSNGFHEYRAMMIADHTGYKNAHPIPAKTLFPVGLHYTVREFFGVCELMIKYQKPYVKMR